MGELGNLFRINLKTYEVDKYPIIYENKDFTYYKVYGSNDLNYIGTRNIKSYNEFKSNYSSYDDKSAYAYTYFFVKAEKKIIPDFSFMTGLSHEERSKREKETHISSLKKCIDSCKNSIYFAKKDIEHGKNLIEKAQNNIPKLEEQLQKYEEELLKLTGKNTVTNFVGNSSEERE